MEEEKKPVNTNSLKELNLIFSEKIYQDQRNTLTEYDRKNIIWNAVFVSTNRECWNKGKKSNAAQINKPKTQVKAFELN